MSSSITSLLLFLLFFVVAPLSKPVLAAITFPYNVPLKTLTNLPKSGSKEILLLSRKSSDGRTEAVGRSYDGRDWESVAPTRIANLFDCSSSSPTSSDYSRCWATFDSSLPHTIVSVTQSEWRGTSVDAWRLLLQGTFGATKATVDAFLSAHPSDGSLSQNQAAAASWIDEQMKMAPTLLRRHWRERTSPRSVSILLRCLKFSEKSLARSLTRSINHTGMTTLLLRATHSHRARRVHAFTATFSKYPIQTSLSRSAPQRSAVPLL